MNSDWVYGRDPLLEFQVMYLDIQDAMARNWLNRNKGIFHFYRGNNTEELK